MEEGGSFGRRAKRSLSSSSLSSSLSRAFLNVGGPAAVIALSLSNFVVSICFFLFWDKARELYFRGGGGGGGGGGKCRGGALLSPPCFFLLAVGLVPPVLKYDPLSLPLFPDRAGNTGPEEEEK